MRDDIKNYFNENFSWQELALKYADNIKNITNK
jgi:hypothetical protein